MLFCCGCTYFLAEILFSIHYEAQQSFTWKSICITWSLVLEFSLPKGTSHLRGLQGGSCVLPEVGFRTQRRCLYSLRCQRSRLWRACGQEDGSSHHQVWRWSWCRAEHAGRRVFLPFLVVLFGDFGGRRMPRKDQKGQKTQKSFSFFVSFCSIGGQEKSFTSWNFWVCLLSVKLGRTPWHCHHFLKVSKKSWPFTPSRTGRWVLSFMLCYIY